MRKPSLVSRPRGITVPPARYRPGTHAGLGQPANLPAMKRGQVILEEFESAVLRDNGAGDPHVRTVPVYLPPSYAADRERRYPVTFVLSGFTGRGRALLNDNPWSPALHERMDGLIARGACEEMILVLPD